MLTVSAMVILFDKSHGAYQLPLFCQAGPSLARHSSARHSPLLQGAPAALRGAVASERPSSHTAPRDPGATQQPIPACSAAGRYRPTKKGRQAARYLLWNSNGLEECDTAATPSGLDPAMQARQRPCLLRPSGVGVCELIQGLSSRVGVSAPPCKKGVDG